MTLKTSFLSSLAIFFCLDTVYQGDGASVFSLLDVSNLFTIQQILNKGIILTYSGYFLGCLQLCLIDTNNVKGVDVRGIYIGNACISDTFVESICIGVAYVGGVCVKDTSIKSVYSSGVDAIKHLEILLQ